MINEIHNKGHQYIPINNTKYPIWTYDINKERFKLLGDYILYRKSGTDEGYIRRRKEGLMKVSRVTVDNKSRIVVFDSLPNLDRRNR